MTPLKTVLVDFVVCRDSQGGNGWQDTPAMLSDFNLLIDSVNWKYANPATVEWPMTCSPQIDYYGDSKVRFKLNNVYYVDSTVWNLNYSGSAASAILEYVWATYPGSKGRALTHIWTHPSGVLPDTIAWAGGWWGYYSNYSGESYVFTRNAMWGNSSIYTRAHVSHEYGHSVGLHHTYDSEVLNTQHFDFLEDLFGTCSEPAMMDPNNPCFMNCPNPNLICACNPPPGVVCYITTNCYYDNYPNAVPPLMSNAEYNRYISPKSSGRMPRSLALFNNNFLPGLNNKPMHKYVEEKFHIPCPIPSLSMKRGILR